MNEPTQWIGFAARMGRRGKATQGPAVAVLDAKGALSWSGFAPMAEVRRHLRLDSDWLLRLLQGAVAEAPEWRPVVAIERHVRRPLQEDEPYQLGRVDGLLEGITRGQGITCIEIDREHWLGESIGALSRRPAGQHAQLVLEAACARWPSIVEKKATVGYMEPWPSSGQAKACAIAEAAWIAERARAASARKESA